MQIKPVRRCADIQTSNALPDLYANDGLLKLFVDECVRSAPERAQPFLALGAALAVVGALAGRRYQSPTGLRTNMLCLALGPSACGKNAAQEVATELLCRADLSHYLAGDPQSGNALMAELVEHPVRLLVMDELGQWIAKLTSPKAAAHVAAIKRNAMVLFSSANRTVAGSSYADAKLRKRVDIIQPHFCIYGAGTPERFWEAIQSGAITDGFVPRFLLFKPDVDYPPLIRSPAPMRITEAMTAAARQIACGGAVPDGGNLAHALPVTMRMASDTGPDVRTVPWTPDGEAEHERWRTGERERRLLAAGGETERVLVGRWAEHAAKLAMVRAISRDPVTPAMTASDARWGWRLAEHCIATMLAMAQRHVAANEQEANVNRVLNAIRDAGAGGITANALHVAARTIRAADRKAILADLVEGGAVTERATPTTARGGRPGRQYVAAEFSG
jgi:Protein of unknown function (DUF3987)